MLLIETILTFQMNLLRLVVKCIAYILIYGIDHIDSLLDYVFEEPKRKSKYEYIPKKDGIHSVQIHKSESSVTYRAVRAPNLFKLGVNEPSNIYDAIAKQATANPDVEILGHREVVSVEDQKQSDGKVIRKYTMKDVYSWITYKEMMERIDSFANGLLSIGLKSNDNIVIFSETRSEWLMCAVACFKIKVPIVTLYATLGLEALEFGINQTNASFLIASGESVMKLQKVIDKCEKLKTVIVISDKLTHHNVMKLRSTSQKVNVLTMEEVEEKGKRSPRIDNYERPNKEDLAIIMYTSGSTGTPKGAMMTHGNLLTSINPLMQRFEKISDQVFIAYLPLAHVLELTAELTWIANGIQIGYSTPFTLTDTSTGIYDGQKGDIRILKPTFMFTVPLVLERIKKAVEVKLKQKSALFQTIFKTVYERKLRKMQLGQSSILLDEIVFRKFKELLGGRVEKILVGGALLNGEIHEFAQVCLCPVLQAYGLTETSAAATTQFPNESATEQVGSVVECCELKLVDWPEGGYRVSDKPNPRGEIWIGGDNVSLGYYQMPEKTKEDFKVIDGVRYFATGDIGEMDPRGNLKIIDRKKDIVKLQGGEYVSLNKVETVIKLMQIVDNCCVIINPSKSYCACIITPNLKKSQEYLSSKKIDIGDSNLNPDELLKQIVDKSNSVMPEFCKELKEHCLRHGLAPFEIPTRVKFVSEIWLPDSGLVTDSFKLKRREIDNFYSSQIKLLFRD